MIIRIYTDGACSGNPGPGGWGVVANTCSGCKKFSGGEANTTNNRMELAAVVQGLKKVLEHRSCGDVYELYSDSAYVVNGINNRWAENWKRSGWLTKKKEKVKNVDLWEQVLILLESIRESKKDIKIIKVKGHSGNTLNEMCDKIAKEEVNKIMGGRDV